MFRLALLRGKPRDQAVVKLAAEQSGWSRRLPVGEGRGFAYHVSFGTRVAMAHTSVDAMNAASGS